MKTFQQFELKIISSHVNRAMKSDLRDSMDFSDIMKVGKEVFIMNIVNIHYGRLGERGPRWQMN
jgi:hypothetical protein